MTRLEIMEMCSPEYPELANREYSWEDIEKAIDEQRVIFAYCTRADANNTLEIEFNHKSEYRKIKGKIAFEDFEYRVDGCESKPVAALSRVGFTVALVPTGISIDCNTGEKIVCGSRSKAQQICRECLINTLTRGDIIDAYAVRTVKYGVFCDIGCGIISLLPIRSICVPNILNLSSLMRKNRRLRVVVSNIREDGKIDITHKELLGTWEENLQGITEGETVIGTVTSIHDFGIFVELAQNLNGLAKPIDDSLKDSFKVEPGDTVGVLIKQISPNTMKIRLRIINKLDEVQKPKKFKYFIEGDHIDKWEYAPAELNEDRRQKQRQSSYFTDFTKEPEE